MTAPDAATPPPEAPSPSRGRGLLAAVGTAALLIAPKAAVALKALGSGKLLLTLGSMLAMLAVEAMQGGWVFATGFVALILVHELGHGVAIKRAGMQAGYPVFIPFFGAFISMRGQVRSRVVEAEIALAGPAAGTAGALAVAALYLLTHQRPLLAIAYAGFFLNLFNLTPLGFLDGGRVTQLFARRAWILGLVIFAGLFAFTMAPQLLLVGLMALRHAISAPTNADTVEASPADRARIARAYFGLCALLAASTACARMLLRH